VLGVYPELLANSAKQRLCPIGQLLTQDNFDQIKPVVNKAYEPLRQHIVPAHHFAKVDS
jgi:hypothetical protein